MNPPRIPNIFHFIFGLKRQTEPFHLLHYLCLKSCIEINQPETIYFYCHERPYGRYWDLIKDSLTIENVDRNEFISRFVYQNRLIGTQYSYAHHADFIRLEKLLQRGGVYADIDTLFVKKLPERLFQYPFVLGEEGMVRDETTGLEQESLCNALIMAEPDAPFARLWRQGMESAFDGTWSRHSTLFPAKLRQQHPTMIHVEPQTSFYHFLWRPEDLQLLFEGCQRNLPEIYSIHLWAHLWWAKRRRDFSRCHAGSLTEKFIRKVDTTFNLLARPFLPPVAAQGRLRSFFSRAGRH